ncbi:2-aminoadipate transaminase [Anabrus simplex]|uniref:2-aminoadipate transaminase n=1 Tax=Anabrus simplex TaxID=316456 RepID=UPI0035A2B536
MTRRVEDPYLRHLFDGTPNNVYSTEVTNLSAGAPGPDLLKLCTDSFTEATLHRMEKEKEYAYLFQYGITSGLWEFRQELAKFLTKHYGEEVHREDLILTCGATHGLQLVMTTFLYPNSVIFVEEVTYMIALETFKQYPWMKVVPVPITAEGVDAEALEKIASREKKKGTWNCSAERPFWAMFYTIPLFHNPTGVTMSESTCKKVIKIARELDFVVLCDDVYNLLYYGDDLPPKRLIAYDAEMDGMCGGHVISNGSFSKILAPGVRIGWLELPSRLALILRKSGILLSGGACNNYMSGIVTSLLELGLQDKHLSLLKDTFKERLIALCDALDKNLPQGCSYRRPKGGYFVWLELPVSVNSTDFNAWCQKKYKIGAFPGHRFSCEGKYHNYLRLGIAFHSREVLECSAVKLCSALSEYLVNHHTPS